ncbi:MAG TPA: APC family permease [Pyrinomonadaceae bacterium]|nr:APC family permease [Pyrinomonadaceae bacterium]
MATDETTQTETSTDGSDERAPKLIRGVGVTGATTLNMIDMIGVGPFITIPLIIAAMGGPQAMLGWIVGAVLVICDGLVWAELGAMFPGSGGAYRYLNEIYGRGKLGRLMSFLFIWQLTFSAPLSMASGCLGFALYATYAFPSLSHTIAARDFHLPVPVLGQLDLSLVVASSTFVAIGVCALAVFLLYRKITIIERFSNLLWVGVMLTIIWIIGSGLWFFNPAVAFDFPPDAFTLDGRFFTGLGAALLIAVYDYWGYYNVCYFGGEVRDPARTIPRAVLLSIILVAIIYIVMNISILGVIPWREFAETANSI